MFTYGLASSLIPFKLQEVTTVEEAAIISKIMQRAKGKQQTKRQVIGTSEKQSSIPEVTGQESSSSKQKCNETEASNVSNDVCSPPAKKAKRSKTQLQEDNKLWEKLKEKDRTGNDPERNERQHRRLEEWKEGK